ncbi:MAG: septal ring lytic transglycosylase RlpA family protein, partial [Lyngbya sp.]|nr:septal ring lytic transglycosylase RlpA family protein [Lyngbya sp.]
EQGTGNRQEARVKREQVTSAILPTPNSQLLTPNSEERGEKMPNSNVLLSSQALKQPSSDSPSQASTDPVTRASELAAKLNQLNRYQIDANSINVRWNEDQQNYSIEIAGQTLVVIDSDTILPDTTQNLAEDALQATNRLRRQMGYAPPLSKIEGKSPFNHLENAFNRRVLDAVEGWASWYGPGFHGRLTANGERFNQYEMTAAHRSLPFGTTVRVTNTNNGRSVVVRINDRGPFSGGRIIDLSVAAAEAIGMISSGVAPVKVEVLEAQ